MDNYLEKIKRLQPFIKETNEMRMYKKSMTNTFREKDINSKGRIDLSDFNNVISINGEHSYADVEGSTTFETLVDFSLQKNFMPAVVPELKTITVGGAIVGLGIESSSFKYGLVHDNILETDVMLSSGDILTCSRTQNSDLFNALPNSLGSLCYIVRARMKLVRTKKYVHIEKRWYDSYKILCKDMEKVCLENKKDFIDGVAFTKNSGVLILGQMTDDIDCNKLSNYRVEYIYYKSLLPGNSNNDYLTIKDYIWRWDPDWFWCNSSLPFVQNYYVRKYILGERYLRSDMYRWILYKLKWVIDLLGYTKGKEYVIQDILIPVENVTKYLDFIYENILSEQNSQHYVWLCPHHNYSSTLVPSVDNKLYIDVAQWGLFKSDHTGEWYLNKSIEKKCHDLNGIKSLYSTVHYDRNTFYSRYNGNEYNILKIKYDPQNKIRGMYEKCTTR